MTQPHERTRDISLAQETSQGPHTRGDWSYTPRPNSAQARILPDDTGQEYLKFLDFPDIAPERIGALAVRIFAITTDTSGYFETHPNTLKVDGDALFIFNALRHFRSRSGNDQPVSAAEIMSFGRGFRSHIRDEEKLAAPFTRAVQALDAVVRELTGDDLILRNAHGSGSSVRYTLMPDVGVRDERP